MAKEKSDSASFDQELDAVKAVLKALDGLSAESKQWVLKTVSDRLGFQAPAGAGAPPPAPPPGASPIAPASIGAMTPKQFLAAKRPVSDVEQVACLAYYLTHSRNQPQFKTVDITKLNTEAAGGPIGNPARSVNNATHQSRFLAPAGKGKKQITALGEQVVAALPDRAAVKAAFEQAPLKKRRKGKRGRRGGQIARG